MVKNNNEPIEKKEDLTISLIYELCLKQKKFLVLFIVSFLVLTLIYSFIIPSEYESSASVLPPEENESRGGLSGYLQSLSGGISIPGISQSNKSQLLGDIIKSREVAKFIIDKCNLKNYPQFENYDYELLCKIIIEHLDVEIKRTGLMIITYSTSTGYFPSKKNKDSASVLSARIANTAIEGLDYVNRTKNVSQSKRKRIFIERILSDNKIKLDSVDSALETFQKNNKVLALDEQTRAILENAVSVGTELSTAQIDLNLALQDLEPNSPKAQSYKKRVSELKNQYNKIQTGGLVSSDKFSIPLNDVPQLIKEYTNLIRDQKILLQVNMYLETQKYQAAIQEESDIATVEPLDKAIPPHYPSAPSRKMMLVLAFFFSLFGGIGFIVTKAFIQGKVYIKNISPEKQFTET